MSVTGTACSMRSGGGRVSQCADLWRRSRHSFDHLPFPPLLRASTTARPWPFAHVFRGKQSPLQPVMLCVASHKCQRHCGTVINFGALGKMSSRRLFGLSFPTPLPTPAPPRVLKSWVESGMPTSPPPPPPLPPAVTQSQPPPVFGGGGGSSSSWRHKALPDLTMIFFSNHSFFVTPLAVC